MTTALLASLWWCTSPTSAWVLFPGDALNSSTKDIESISDYLNFKRKDGRPPLFRWSAADELRDEYGLGGGITYAFDTDFCLDMLPKFEEAKGALKLYEFVTCDTVKDVVKSALSTWESNNRNIFFTDVSNICDNEDLWEDVSGEDCTSTTCRTCPLAEVVINIFESSPDDHSGARVQPKAIANNPLGTNTERLKGGSFSYAELQYGSNLCWYVDATFCSLFHTMEANGLPVVAIVGIVLGSAFLVAAFVALYYLYTIGKVFLYELLESWDKDGDDDVDVEEVADAVEAGFKYLRKALTTGKFDNSILEGRTIELDDALFAVLDVFAYQLKIPHLTIMMFFLIFPALVLNDVFLPCWNCYDFEAATVHEVGHILGFDHPDQYPGLNFVSDRSEYSCNDTTKGVSMDSAYEANSVMQAFLPRNPKTCLTDDDLDGLNFLYPVCSDNIQAEPVCIQPERNIGWPRLLQSIVASEFIPLLVIVVLKIICKVILATGDYFEERKAKSLVRKAKMEKQLRLDKVEQRQKRKEELGIQPSERKPFTFGRKKSTQVNPEDEEAGNTSETRRSGGADEDTTPDGPETEPRSRLSGDGDSGRGLAGTTPAITRAKDDDADR